MKKRKGGLWQKMMAVLLSAVLITGMVSNAVPMTVLAQENGEATQGATTPETQKTDKPADSENTIPKDSDTGKLADSESTNPEDTDKDKPDGSENLNPGQPETGTPNGSENLNPGQTETGTPNGSENLNPGQTETGTPSGSENTNPEEPKDPDTEDKKDDTEEETEPGTVSGNDAETEPVAAPQIMMMAVAPSPQADNIDSGEGWALDTDGRLTITSDTGMTGWIASRNTTHNGTAYKLLVTSAEITGVTTIGKDAFFGCFNLAGSITLPESVTSIGENAFNNCPKLTGITIPGSVTDIGKTAFAGCAGLTGITIPGSVTSIGDSAFATCEGLTSITIPDTVASIGEGMLFGCSGLTSVTLPNNMTSIPYRMFSQCSSLTSVALPEGVSSIGESAFYECGGLQEITIPSAVTQIGRFAFRKCASLENITFLKDEPQQLGNDVFGYDYSSIDPANGEDERCGFVKNGTQGIHVPEGKVQAYKEAWTEWAAYIADGATPAEKHEHNDVTFTAWTATDSLPTAAGNYYLTKDVTLTGTWSVPSGEVSICLNGKTITQATAEKRVIDIGVDHTFTLYDCGNAGNITGGSGLDSIDIGSRAVFYMYGGNISGNRGNDYGAVSVYGGTFHMCGGKISDNQNNVSSDINRGGGVYVSSGTFYMEGGEISGNSCSNGYGGGVSLRDSTFYMSGGKISGNTNGIYVSDDAEFHMSGGEVSGNTGSPCGGIRLDGKMTAGGNIVITGNKDDEGKDKNLFINSGTFTIDTANPLGFANIGVTTDAKPTEGNPVNITGVTNGNYIPCFHSDNADYEIRIGEYNKVQLAVKAAADTHPPTGTIKIPNIGSSWSLFIDKEAIGFNQYSRQPTFAEISADDKGSGVDKIYYYLSDSALSLAEVNALGETDWTEGDYLSIIQDRKCVIYAKITDKAGNVTYLSSDGLVFDGTPPAIYYVKDGETYYGNQKSVRVIDTNLESVTVNGQEVTLMHEAIFQIKAADGPQTIVATDKAGNTTTVTVTVKANSHTHTMTRVDAKDATCAENGNTAYYICDGDGGCGKWFSDEAGTTEIANHDSVVIPAAGHAYNDTEWGYKEADGHARKCRKCDAHDTVQPHTPGAAATASTPRTCTVCKYVITPALGHTCSLQLIERVEPGCTTAGKQAYYHCEGCEKNYEDAAGAKPITDISTWGIIAAQGHDWGEWTVTKSATAATPGEKERICKRCQQKETETIPATGSGGDKPGGEDKPGGDTPGGEDKPGGDTPGGEDKPGGDTPGGEDKPGGNKPGGNKPGGGSSGSGGSSGENSGGEGDNASGNPGENGSSDGDGQNSNPGSGNGSSGGNNSSNPGAAAPTPGSSRTGQPKVKQEKEGNIQKEVRVEGAETLNAAVETSISELADIILTKEEKRQAAAGANIRIVLEVKDAPAAVSATDKALVESALNSSAARGYTLGQYLDINLYKVVGNSHSAIAETNRKITITIDVPDSLKNTDHAKTRIFAVIRAHNGRTALLTDLDDNADTITIETDRFSTYAIVYKDTADRNMNQGGLSGKPGVLRVSTKSDSKNPGGGKDNEPDTGDRTPIELSATLAMIAGLTYLLLYFANLKHGMTEEAKKKLVSRLVAWAKQGGKGRTYLALAAIFVLLVYYHSIGKKMCVAWEEIYGD